MSFLGPQNFMQDPHNEKIPVGISSCLLGERVRYNGGHKYHSFCAEQLHLYFDFKPFCPEVAIGLGVPRETIHLVADKDGSVRAVGTANSNMDVTDRLREFAESIADQAKTLRGYIFMNKSPSCGLVSANVYSNDGKTVVKGSGVFAERLRNLFPLLPVEEAVHLDDLYVRENFISRVFLYDRWIKEVMENPSAKNLIEFHSRQKYLVMSYGQALYRQAGAIISGANRKNLQNVMGRYIEVLMQGTVRPPTRKGHVNALHHVAGYLRDSLSGELRQNLAEVIEQYRIGQVALAVPINLLLQYLETSTNAYIKQQTYLRPYPVQLRLREEI